MARPQTNDPAVLGSTDTGIPGLLGHLIDLTGAAWPKTSQACGIMRPDFVNLHQQKRMAFIDHDGFHELGKAPHSAGFAVLAFFVNGR